MSVFRDKVAIVTGAGSGIGKALSEELARRGAHVFISDVHAERLEEVRAGIEKAGGKVTAQVLDVTDWDAVKAMVDGAAEEGGKLDYIFNNAGIVVIGESRDVTVDDWKAVLDVNLNGVVHGVNAAYPIMVEQGFGHIVNTSSIEGLIPFPVSASYVASKHAVLGMSTSLRAEGADLGVKVSAVCPGYIKTRIFTESKTAKFDLPGMVEKLLPDRLGITPDECATRILRGVEKNMPIIPVTSFAWIMWILYRVSPRLVIAITRRTVNRMRDEGLRREEP